MSPWWPLLGLLSWCLNHRNSFENRTPADFICGCPIFKWVAATWLHASIYLNDIWAVKILYSYWYARLPAWLPGNLLSGPCWLASHCFQTPTQVCYMAGIWSHHDWCQLIVAQYNILVPEQNGWHPADNIFKCMFLSESIHISIQTSLKFLSIGTN